MRIRAWIVTLVASLAATACGGGSTGETATANVASVQGKLVTRDGATTALEGVAVTCPETGAATTTDHTGGFHLDVPRGEPFHLGFEDPSWTAGDRPSGGGGEPHDPLPDDAEVDGDGVTVRPNAPHEWCEVEVHLEEGEIVECHVRWSDGAGEAHAGEQHMDRDPLCDELDAVAEIEITLEGGCLLVEVEVAGYTGPANLDIYLVDAEGQEAYLETLAIDADGAGHLELAWCEGDPLPFDAASPGDLGGLGIVVYDEAGDVVFRGHLPHHHGEDAMHGPHGGPDEGGGHTGGGPHHGM